MLLDDLLDVRGGKQLHRQVNVVAVDAEIADRDHARMMQFLADFEFVPHVADFLAIVAEVAQQQLDRQSLAGARRRSPPKPGTSCRIAAG